MCGYPGLSLHSFRKSGVKWAALCGAPDWAIRKTGRWEILSEKYYVYIEEGVSLRELSSQSGSIHPIRKMWVYKPTTTTTETS